MLEDEWVFQAESPTRESHYSLQLPPGWEYKASWLNHTEIRPGKSGNGWAWTVTDIKGIREEQAMPPVQGIFGKWSSHFSRLMAYGVRCSAIGSRWGLRY